MKKVFVIGGMSESGKSTVGRYLDSKAIKRLKIVTYLQRVKEKESEAGNFQDWNDRAEQERPEWLGQRFVEEFGKAIDEERIEYACLESLYRPEFGQLLRNSFRDKIVIIYVDVPLNIRLQRQVIREGLSSIEEAKRYLIPRDQRKEEWGVPRIKGIADVVIDNSGSVDELYQKVDKMIQAYCLEVV